MRFFQMIVLWKKTFYHILKNDCFDDLRKHFLKYFQSDCFDERKGFIIFSNNSQLKIFKTGPKKNLRGDLRTKGGTIGKKFFQNMFLWFENDCFDERKRFIIFWNELEAYWKIFKTGPKKKFKGWPQDQRGDHWKKFFSKHVFYHLKMIVLMKENVLSYFETNLKHIEKFSKLVEKKFKGWPQDQRGDHWKKFFSKHVVYDLKMIVLMKENVLFIFWNEFEA